MSDYYLEPLDCNGERITVGDEVLFINITNQLLNNLPNEDQEAICAQKGMKFKVDAFDNSGYVEISFKYKHADSEISFHTVWVEPCCVKRISGSCEGELEDAQKAPRKTA
ncbi:MAG: hypothetical protein HY881_13410 [Deltaproteobacteria bacterium]|nr:hypothetical protein [Deltaproteobacteria bacterium]